MQSVVVRRVDKREQGMSVLSEAQAEEKQHQLPEAADLMSEAARELKKIRR